jgi:hypothetical protein
LFLRSPCHFPDHLHDSFLLRALDHRRDTQPRPHLQTRSPTPCAAFDFFPKRPLDAAWIRCPAIGTHENGVPRSAASAHLLQQPIGQATIPMPTSHPTQPQTGRHHQGQPHLDNHPTPFHANLIHLDVLGLQLPVWHESLMHVLAMLSGSIAPGFPPFVRLSRTRGQSLGWDSHREVNETTITISSVGLRSPSSIVPRRALNVCLHWVQRKRCRLRSCIRILPAPIWPPAEHAVFGQNCFDASIGSVVLFGRSTSPGTQGTRRLSTARMERNSLPSS